MRQLTVQRFIASLAIALVICCPLSAQAAVGRTVGSATVTSIGSASYSIPIVVPPGTAGTTIYEGAAAAQGGLVGGGSQVVIPNVNPAWILN